MRRRLNTPPPIPPGLTWEVIIFDGHAWHRPAIMFKTHDDACVAAHDLPRAAGHCIRSTYDLDRYGLPEGLPARWPARRA